MPSRVNPAITDAVAQANVQVVGIAPAAAMAMLYQATAQALATAAHNATAAQQNANIVLQTSTVQGVAMLLGIGTGSNTAALLKILSSK